MSNRDRHRITLTYVLSILVVLVVSPGCGRKLSGPDYVPRYAEVRFHIDWPPQQFSKASTMSPHTTDIVVRIAKSFFGVETGYRKHVRLGSRWVTMSVAPGHNYDVEFLCLRRSLPYAPIYVPIGYGIKKGLSFTADSTNYVEVDLEPIHLTLAKPDSVYVGDDLSLRLTARNPYMADLSRYLTSTGGFSIEANTPVEYLTAITFRVVSSGNFTTVWEWSYRFDQAGRFSFFIAGAPADWGRKYWNTDFFKAFRVRVEPAWSPQDFGVYGSRFTVVICDNTNAGF